MKSHEKLNNIKHHKKRIFDSLEIPEKALRKELWLLAKEKAAEEPRYKVDDIIKEAGHEVLRLPPYHCDLNPIGIFHKYYFRCKKFNYDFLLQKISRLE